MVASALETCSNVDCNVNDKKLHSYFCATMAASKPPVSTVTPRSSAVNCNT